ncbi:hypothetical protein [Glycomyces tenuis]|uniref:hypothetical protein n=1 Tax=Glycomyces tenuis TaxID=58116 RepID=UPI000AD477BA|nr:hypothetical protein [Glycomyces tenuis]
MLAGRAGGYSEVELGTRWSQESYLHFYACAVCGYLESYINPDRLDKVVKHGRPLRPS